MADRIPAISLWRPWNTCIVRYQKAVENRGWSTKYRGPMFVHGAKRWDDAALSFAAGLGIGLSPNSNDHPTGVVAIVDLVGICDACETGDRCDCGPWAMADSYHWQVTNVRAFAEPVDCLGKQGLWWPTGELAERLAAATAGAVAV